MKNICLSFMSGSAVTALAVIFAAGFSARMFFFGFAIALGLVGAFGYFIGPRKLARFLTAFAEGIEATGERPEIVAVPEVVVSPNQNLTNTPVLSSKPDPTEEIVAGLRRLGSKKRDAQNAVTEAAKTHPDPEGMLKRAIELLKPTPIKKVA